MSVLIKILASILNFVNNVLHTELIAILLDGLFWIVILLVGFPLAAFVALIKMCCDVTSHFLRGKDVDPKSSRKNQEYCVVITGCDSGFGKELVSPLVDRGFTVFCGCLQKESFQCFQDEPLAIPFHLDVTSDQSVADAFKLVTSWMNASKKKRYLHALVNNAGILRVGLVDWAKLSDFKAAMDVNYVGMVRVCKGFLPIFQQQAADKAYFDARIVNMISMAGLFSGGGVGLSPYFASKHAADAFTCNLQLEMKPYDVKVIALNPTFHSTPMADPNIAEKQMRSVWNSCPGAQREEYGEGKSMLLYHSRFLVCYIKILC